jgi:hypothetical protein
MKPIKKIKMENKSVTAVEWLIEQIIKYDLVPQGTNPDNVLFHKALEMEKQQAERSYTKEEVDDLLDRLLEGNMCSVVGEELIEKFQKV